MEKMNCFVFCIGSFQKFVLLPSIVGNGEWSCLATKFVFVSISRAPFGVAMDRLLIEFIQVAEVPRALIGAILAGLDWSGALISIWMSLAIFCRAIWIFYVFLLSLAEFEGTFSVPKAVFSCTWLGASILIFVFCLGTESSFAMIESWISMANINIAVLWKSIFT
jgi:hypothetical protein